MKLSVAMITYNQEEFIAQAIESVLAQRTNFPFEVVIGEDFSKDRTRDIVRMYGERHPDKIRLLLPERNLGMNRNFVQVVRACRGQYIAILEGDDYWTSTDKIQRQVDFLESRPECSVVFHRADWLEGGTLFKGRFGPPVLRTYYTLEDLLRYNNFLPTCSVVFRKGLFGDFPEWYFDAPSGDFPLHALNSMHGKIGFIDESLSVYRRHGSGVHGGETRIRNLEKAITVYLLVGKHLQCRSSGVFREAIAGFYAGLVREFAERGQWGASFTALVKGSLIFPRNTIGLLRMLLVLLRTKCKSLPA